MTFYAFARLLLVVLAIIALLLLLTGNLDHVRVS